MPCFLIDPTQKTITAVEGGGDLTGVRALIGFETVDSDEIDANGDRLYFDEKCFIRQTPGVGRFQLDSLAAGGGHGRGWWALVPRAPCRRRKSTLRP